MKRLLGLFVVLPVLVLPVFAGTNTPHPAGSKVAVTTSAGTVRGTLQDSKSPDWLAVLEKGETKPTYVRVTGAIVRLDDGLAVVPLDKPFFKPAGLELKKGETRKHFVFGMPRPTDKRHQFTPKGHAKPVPGITVLRRTGFTLGHYDEFKVPAWVAMRWTKKDLRRSEQVDLDRPPFKEDGELPDYAQATPDYFASKTGYQRGHMARDADLEAWGKKGVSEGMKMSNVVPQRQGKNHRIWGYLEDEHRTIVDKKGAQVTTVWIICGPVFRFDDDKGDDEALTHIANSVGVPHATYKVIAWETSSGQFHVQAFVIPQTATKSDLTHYLTSVRDVEEQTGLDFFHELEDSMENQLESREPAELWRE